MKIKGKQLRGPNIEILVLPRGDEDLIFKAEAVLSTDNFDKMCPRPKPPTIFKRGEGRVADLEDKTYKARLNDYAEKRLSWLVIESLKPSEIEWEKVKINNSETWNNWKTEFQESGFSENEIGRIIQLVMSVNCLDEKRLEEARARFLARQEMEQEDSISQDTEPTNTSSGVHVNGSA